MAGSAGYIHNLSNRGGVAAGAYSSAKSSSSPIDSAGHRVDSASRRGSGARPDIRRRPAGAPRRQCQRRLVRLHLGRFVRLHLDEVHQLHAEPARSGLEAVGAGEGPDASLGAQHDTAARATAAAFAAPHSALAASHTALAAPHATDAASDTSAKSSQWNAVPAGRLVLGRIHATALCRQRSDPALSGDHLSAESDAKARV